MGEAFAETTRVFFGSEEVEILYTNLEASDGSFNHCAAGNAGNTVSVRVQNADGRQTLSIATHPWSRDLQSGMSFFGRARPATSVLVIGRVSWRPGFRRRHQLNFRAELDDVLWVSPSILGGIMPPYGAVDSYEASSLMFRTLLAK